MNFLKDFLLPYLKEASSWRPEDALSQSVVHALAVRKPLGYQWRQGFPKAPAKPRPLAEPPVPTTKGLRLQVRKPGWSIMPLVHTHARMPSQAAV